MLRRKLKNNKGFSLVEMVIAIAILAVFSGVVLQLFVLSNRLSVRVELQDAAAAQMQSMLEVFKQDPEKVRESELMEGAVWSGQGEERAFEIYYDSGFNPLPQDRIEEAEVCISGVVGPAQPQAGVNTDAKALPMSLTPSEDDPVCKLMSMQVQAERIDRSERVLLSVTGTLKYSLPKAQ